jgi:hypothetical protein
MARQTAEASPPAPAGPVLVVVDVRSADDGAKAVQVRLASEFPGREVVVIPAGWRPNGAGLLEGDEASAPRPGASPVSLVRGGIGADESALLAVLREGVRREAAAVALVAGEVHDEGVDWLRRLVAPVLEEGYDYVCPTYVRHAVDGALNTGVVYPLTRALYGRRLRQPLGGEGALSTGLARALVADPDWRRHPERAGSDAWLVAKVLSGEARVCQAWLGAWPRPAAAADDASHVVDRVLGLVFGEMEQHAEHWQRVEGSQPLPTLGEWSPPADDPPRPRVDKLVAAFQLGVRELEPVWSAVLPPASILALRRAAARPPEEFRIDDTSWARVVYDFAVGHYARAIERRQLLRSMTPLYLGWVASFANETRDLDAAAAEERVEALCAAFESEKRRLVSRWRWPEG